MTTASKIIKVTIQSNYGNDMAYPVNDIGVMMCQLMGTKTFPSWGIAILKANGYTFKTVPKESFGLGVSIWQ